MSILVAFGGSTGDPSRKLGPVPVGLFPRWFGNVVPSTTFTVSITRPFHERFFEIDIGPGRRGPHIGFTREQTITRPLRRVTPRQTGPFRPRRHRWMAAPQRSVISVWRDTSTTSAGNRGRTAPKNQEPCRTRKQQCQTPGAPSGFGPGMTMPTKFSGKKGWRLPRPLRGGRGRRQSSIAPPSRVYPPITLGSFAAPKAFHSECSFAVGLAQRGTRPWPSPA